MMQIDIATVAKFLGRAQLVAPNEEPDWIHIIRKKYGRKYGQPLIQTNRAGELVVCIGYAEVRGMFMAEKCVYLDFAGKTPEEIWDDVRENVKAIRAEYAAEQAEAA